MSLRAKHIGSGAELLSSGQKLIGCGAKQFGFSAKHIGFVQILIGSDPEFGALFRETSTTTRWQRGGERFYLNHCAKDQNLI
jgi:hypothetical protein